MPPKRQIRIDPEFGRRLRVAMEGVDLSSSDLAGAERVAAQTVSRWRRGERPDDLRLPGLAERLRVRLAWLDTGEGPMQAGDGVLREVTGEGGVTEVGHEPGEGIGWLWGDPMEAQERVETMLRDVERTVRTSNSGLGEVGLQQLRVAVLDALIVQCREGGNPVPGWLSLKAYEAGKRVR